MVLPDVPVRRSTASVDVLADLARTGLSLVDAVPDPVSLLALARCIGAVVVPHRDSGPDGVTVIEDRGASAAALAGFTCASLYPHTDRSGVVDPPGLLFTVCGREPTEGGESLLVDGRAVYLDLEENDPEALAALSVPSSALFGGADGCLASVFATTNDVVSIRLRLDSLARFGSRVEPHIPALRAGIERHMWAVPARSGTGYVLDNRRWLHGRRSYVGPRVIYRITADASRSDIVMGGFPRSMDTQPGESRFDHSIGRNAGEYES
ncbi:TauD/TfdA family dioxygenase [Pseudonocardia sp. HH130630-07]|uniref:TauD/TfdA family dioxygenase n=1 Tax=Pseudonocardia sp. HH130630-07 TaxID=1690815 RepID=UPI0018D34CE9|nr:TauD/TfdA family dioxygenase [Pseudonocardia sp. HH130630-07]